jgi:hypothetical protein
MPLLRIDPTIFERVDELTSFCERPVADTSTGLGRRSERRGNRIDANNPIDSDVRFDDNGRIPKKNGRCPL